MKIDAARRAAARASDKADDAETKAFEAKTAASKAWRKYDKLVDSGCGYDERVAAWLAYDVACRNETRAKNHAKSVEAKAKAAKAVADKLAA